MEDLNEMLRPHWGSEKWIQEGWEQISLEDKKAISARLDSLFKDGLPFEMKHSKLLYIYSFCLLAQLEVLAIQVPLKFKNSMVSSENQQRMHNQLLDEIFHGLVFTKIVYLLCEPYAMPPAYNSNLEQLCNFVRNEECPKVAIMLLNLIAEGWIEEAFKCFARYDIAPNIFKVILEDEHRHVSEADLYKDVGLPDLNVMQQKLEFLEEQLLVNFFLQHQFMIATTALLGFNGAADFIHSLDKKHRSQLKKIGLNPSNKWVKLTQILQNILPKIQQYSLTQYEIEMTPMRQLLMTQWDSSSEATMFSQCSINITEMDFFNKKHPHETLTTLMLQTVSLWLQEHEDYKSYLHHQKLFRSTNAYVGVIVKLPGCRDHLGTVFFSNCHEMGMYELANKIRQSLQLMVYCYQKRESLEKMHPHLKAIDPNKIYDFAQNVYGHCMPGSPIVTLSNIGPWGFNCGKSPLLKNESLKLVMLEVERKQVWDNNTKTFVIKDILPLSISADHRVFDANTSVPKMLNNSFKTMYQALLQQQPGVSKSTEDYQSSFHYMIEQISSLNIDFAYKILNVLQTVWPDYLNPQELINVHSEKSSVPDKINSINNAEIL